MRNVTRCALTLIPALWLAQTALAQDEAIAPVTETDDQQSSTVPTSAPIIVTADPAEQPKVILGSRIPKKQTVKFIGIATNTGTRGLTPGSGMDQGASVRTIRQSKCTSDDPEIGRKAACLMIDADAAYAQGDVGKAQDFLAYLTLTEDFTPYERLQGAKRQYRIADEMGSDASRETALEQMVETGGMERGEELRARRSLISMAIQNKQITLARERMLELDGLEGLSAQRLANLAVFTRQLNAGDAKPYMLRAIALREKKGRKVPKSWYDFVKPADAG